MYKIAKSVIFEDLPDFLTELGHFEHVMIEVGMGQHKHSSEENYIEGINSEEALEERLVELRKIIVDNNVSLDNIRLHAPVGYKYELYFDEWDAKEKKRIPTFNTLYSFIKKASSLGFKAITIHPPAVMVFEQLKDKEPFQIDFEKQINNLVTDFKKLNSLGVDLYLEFINLDDFTSSGKWGKRLFKGISLNAYKFIVKQSEIKSLIDTGAVFKDMAAFHEAKRKLDKEGFKVEAVHFQGNYVNKLHGPLSVREFIALIQSFEGILIDEGLYGVDLDKKQFQNLLYSGKYKSFLFTPKQNVQLLRLWQDILTKFIKQNKKLDPDLISAFEKRYAKILDSKA